MGVTIDADWIRIDNKKLRMEDFNTGIVEFLTDNAGLILANPGFKVDKPSIDQNPKKMGRILREITKLWTTIVGNLKTSKDFKRVHKANIVRNLEYCQFHTITRKGSGKGIILASGPSLDLKKKYHGVLYALPSSLMALKEAKIAPYGVVQLDPGFWAKAHTFYLPTGAILFCALRCAIPYGIAKKFKIVPYAVGDDEVEAWDKVYDEPIMRLPQGQTVAIPAIELVWNLHSQMEVVGLDLSYDDVHGHVRPHTFEYQKYLGNRLSPAQDMLYTGLMNDDPIKVGSVYTTGGLRFMRQVVGNPREYSYSLGVHRKPTLKPLKTRNQKLIEQIQIEGEFEKLPRKLHA